MDFLEKLSNAKKELKGQKESTLHEEAQIELLLFLKSTIDSFTSLNELEDAVQADLLTSINHPDPDERPSIGQKIKLLEVLKKKKSEDTAAILSLLKQNASVTQNNLTVAPPGTQQQRDEKDITSKITKQDYQKVQRALEFIDAARKTEGLEPDDISIRDN